MQLAGVNPDPKTFVSVLPACASLAAVEQGMKIHEHIIRSGFQSDIFVQSALVDMYAKCGSIEKARHVFDKMNHRNVVSWNSMIAGYVQNGRVDEALSLFDKMPARDVVSWTAMIAGYAQNGHVDEAFKLFQKIPKPNVVSWNAMIAGYAQNGQGEDALNLFRQMKLSGVNPDPKTVASVLPACANLAALEQGKEIHGYIIRTSFDSDIFVDNAIIDMYAKCGNIEDARRVFDRISQRNVVTWNTMIAGYVQNGHVNEAEILFRQLLLTSIKPDVISWNTMIAGYVHVDQALKLFLQMHSEGVKPDSVTIATILSTCVSLAALYKVKEIHCYTIQSGIETNVYVGSALVATYARCGDLENARRVFDKMSQRNVVSWNTVIAGCVQNGYGEEAFKLFWQMRVAGLKPDAVTIASILSACADSRDLEQGKRIHGYIIRYEIELDVFMESALVAMYAKCGSIENARKMFDRNPQISLVSWNAMISGSTVNGFGDEALKYFRKMQHVGMKPNSVTMCYASFGYCNLFPSL